MKLTLLLIPLLFFMTSCTIDWNDEKDKKIAELEKQNSNFEKNMECLNKKDLMLEFWKTKYPSLWSIEEIIYKDNNCYFIWRDTRNIDTNISRDFLILFDFLNQTVISETPISMSWDKMDNWEFDKKIKELKWE